MLNLLNPYRFSSVVNNNKFWIDPSDTSTILATSGFINQINDISGNNNNATATGSSRPLTGGSINGLNAIRFDGNDDFLSANSLATFNNGTETKYTLHCVFKLASLSTGSFNSFVFGFGLSLENPWFDGVAYSSSSPNTLTYRRRAGAEVTLADTYFGTADLDPHCISIVKKGLTFDIWLDGIKVIDNESTFSNFTFDRFAFGALVRVTDTLWSNVDLGEVIFFNKQQTDTEVGSFHNYLGNKWL